DFLENSKKAYSDIIHPDCQAQVRKAIDASIKAKKSYQFEYKIITADKREKWVWEQGRAVFSGDNQLVALEGIITDINQLKQAETALRESEKRFRSLIENVPSIAVQGYDTHHNIFFWNKASETFFGFTKDEATDQKLENLIYPVYSREGMRKAIDNWINKGKPIPSGETSLLHKDGSVLEVHSSHVMLKNKQNQPELYCLNIDVTELNQTKKDLQKSLYQLKRAL
ncbi:MAG: PAS domain-containing protein, partial [bacterium]|nr:PAS domain-containing protein [bacterium]